MEKLQNLWVNFLSFFQGEWDTLKILTLIDRILLFGFAILIAWKVLHYLVRYRILQTLFLRFQGNMKEYDKARRLQMQREVDENQGVFHRSESKISLLSKIYSLISRAGITKAIPGFSESEFLIGSLMILFTIFCWTWKVRDLFFAGIFSISLMIIEWYTISLIAYQRLIKLEDQLIEFANACASTSVVYSNLIDIFGAIYDQFENPLRLALEECYIEAKQTNDSTLAIEHLKKTFDSVHFSFVLDNLTISSKISEDYQEAAKNICDILIIFYSSREKKKAILKKARIDICTISFLAVLALFIISFFFEGMQDVIFRTSIGNSFLLGIFMIFFYGINIKTEKR